MSGANRDIARDANAVRRARPRNAASIEAIRECITPILTSTMIARALCVDRRQKLALEIIDRQTHELAQLLKEAFGVEMQPRLD